MNNSGLNKQQKEAVGLLSIGTFLEFFDLLLYVHMAVLLNELFFPQGDPLTAQLLSAFTFSSTYLMRPIGGLIIGWIGDKIGRKSTIIITTSIMACACIVMANLKTYAEIGLTASVVMILCRMLQGFSSIGEGVGAELYLSETLKSPYRYVYCEVLTICTLSGGLAALAIASLSISAGFNWRLAFWFGAFVAIIGMFARTRLRETPEFVDYKRRMAIRVQLNKQDPKLLKTSTFYKEKTDKNLIFTFFLIVTLFPIGFNVSYRYLSEFMKNSLGMTAEEVINQNLKLTIITVIGAIIITFLVRKIHPIKVALWSVSFMVLCLPFIPWWLENITDTSSLLVVQVILFIMALNSSGTLNTAFFRYIPIAKRFTITATTFGVASASGHLVVSYSLIPLEKYFGHYGIWGVYVPGIIAFYYVIYKLVTLERKRGAYDKYPEEGYDVMDTAVHEEGFDYGLGEDYQNFDVNCEYSQSLLNKLKRLNQVAKKKINIELVEKAIVFAKKWHDTVKRKTGEPYYSHPLAVADIISEYYFKTDVIVAAILHDVVEDSDCTVELIAEEFNQRVAEMVDKLTRIRFIDGKYVKLSLDETVDHLHQTNDNEVLLIKQIDRLHNLHTIEGMEESKQREIAAETTNVLMSSVAYTAEKLNIPNKLDLENRIFEESHKTLKKTAKKQ